KVPAGRGVGLHCQAREHRAVAGAPSRMAVPLTGDGPLPADRLDPGAATLLIVDDTPANLDALEALLEPTGCGIVRAHSGEEALLALLHQDFAAIILDIRMPGMGGIDLARLIKQR